MPPLETLKKQAKQLVRWHRQGNWTVAERIRNGLPRYAAMTDHDIMQTPFALAEAQELIARERGFEGWTALRAGLPEAPEPPAALPETPVLGAAEPTLFVSDVTATCRFFAEQLGFSTVFTYGEPPFYGQVARGQARINIRHADPPVFAGDIREREELLSVSVGVENVKALYAEYRARGAPIFQTLKRHPWGAQDFVVRDPDGNLLGFVFNP